MMDLDLTKCGQGQLFCAKLESRDYSNAYLVEILIGFPTKMVSSYNASLYDDKDLYTNIMDSVMLQSDKNFYFNLILGRSRIVYQELCFITSDDTCREVTKEYVDKVVNIQLQKPMSLKNLKYMRMDNIKLLLDVIPNYSSYLARTAMMLSSKEKDLFITTMRNIDTLETVNNKLQERYDILKRVETSYKSFGKVQNKVLGRVYLKKKKSGFDLYVYIGRLNNNTKPYVFVTLCRDEDSNRYSAYVKDIKDANCWYIDTAIQRNKGKVLRMDETKFSNLVETDLQIRNQTSHWVAEKKNQNWDIAEYLERYT